MCMQYFTFKSLFDLPRSWSKGGDLGTHVYLTRLELLWFIAAAYFCYSPSGPSSVWVMTGFGWYFFGGAWRWQMYPLSLATVALAPGLVFDSDFF